jgi:hypothetical protein
MGYACPVCETPQADATHLANHLAFTALIRGGEHETWLDERCPGWEAAGEAALADRVAERVDPDPQSGPGPGRPDERASGERPEVREGEPVRSRADERPIGGPPSAAVPDAEGENDGDGDGNGNEGATEDVLERARELTRRRRADRDDATGEDGDSPQADE